MRDQLVVILGMHRSGTSLVTGSLPLLGFPLGNNLMRGNADNPKGFFEDLDVVSLNDDLLSLNYSSWDSPLLNLDHEIKFTEDQEKRARKLLQLRLAETGKWVMKDPRLCLLMPFWRAQFEATSVQPHYVGVYRDPLAIAASLQKRNQLGHRHSLLLCYIYLRSMMHALGDKAFVISYDKFVDEPRVQLARLASHIEVQMDPDAVDPFLQLHLDPTLRHHRNLSGELFQALGQLSKLMIQRASDETVSVSTAVDPQIEDQQLEKELLAIQVQRDFADRADLSHQKQRLEAEKKLLQSDLTDSQSRLVEREKHIDILEQETVRLGKDLQTSGAILTERDDQIEKLYVLQGALEAELNQRSEEIKELGRHLKDFDRIHREVLRSVSFRLGRILTFPLRKPLNVLLLNRLEADSFWRNIIGFLRNCVSHPVAALKLVSLARLRNFYLVLAKRRDLADQIVANYEEMIFQEPVERLAGLHQYSKAELQDYRLTLKTSSDPVVSVLIPVYNQLDHTLQCLESIAENTPLVPFEVIVANDCSTDSTAEVVGRVEGVRLVNNRKNLKFLQNCNYAAAYCRGDFIFLLNNDTVAKSGWLDTLLAVFESRADAGLVGSKLVYPDGRLQEAGGIVWSDGSAWNFGRLEDPKLPEYNYLREVDYVSGAAVMIRRQLFEDLGRFDTLFQPAYYEDTDLAFKVRDAGLKVYYQPRSEIVHYEGISHGTDESIGMKRYQSENRQQFLVKWQSVLLEQHFSNGERVLDARDRSRDKTKVLVVDHYVPHFDKDAGSRSTFLYLKLLVEAGCQVKFLGDNFYQHEPYTGILQNIGIEVLYGRHYQKNWKSWLQKHAAEIDVIYIMRPHIAEKYIDTINQMDPKPRTIYFGHDLHFLRLRRQAEITLDPVMADEAVKFQDKEFELFHKVDRIYYPSEVEVEEIKNIEPDLPVKTIPLYPIQEFDQSPVDFMARKGLLFVGGFNHPPNADGLMWFVDQVLPQLGTDIRLNIVGSNISSQIQDLDGDQIVVHGFLSDEDLDDLYRKVSIAIVPLRFGAGIKGKVLEAMNRGVPVVTTSIGAEGIPGGADVLLVTDDAEAMARQIDLAMGDLELLNKYSKLGREAVQRHFSTELALSIISEDFFLQAR